MPMLALLPLAAAAQSPWFDGEVPGQQARAAVIMLGAAASHGLEPADDGVQALQLALAEASRAAYGRPGDT